MKQAVVLIHGIGEQKPMDTLRRFVAAILPPAADGHEQYWSKPDRMTELFELRRLQTPGRTKAHFFEYYWAYHVDGTKLWHLWEWLKGLLFRKPSNVPSALKFIWRLTWLGLVALVVLTICGVFDSLQGWYSSLPRYGLVGMVLLLLGGTLHGVLIYYVGDAARYLSPHPQNIALRQKIRSEGIKLLRNLHESRKYDRIILVGHSLGSVIGYDIISRLWIDYYPKFDFESKDPILAHLLSEGKAPQPVIRKSLLEAGKNCSEGRSPEALQQFRDTQLGAWREQRGWGNPWRISDFVTVGSPLSHAMLLLACGKEDFEERKRERELPVCPPVEDEKGYAYCGNNFQLENGKRFTPLYLHHAAPFAVTRWTNLYFPALFGLFGDGIGGPLRDSFGTGIKDVPVKLKSWRRFTPAAHTAYWKVEASAENSQDEGTMFYAIAALKEALALDRLRKFRSKR